MGFNGTQLHLYLRAAANAVRPRAGGSEPDGIACADRVAIAQQDRQLRRQLVDIETDSEAKLKKLDGR